MLEDQVTAAAAVTKPAPPCLLNAERRFRTVTLDWPVEAMGRTIRTITVRRLTTAEVAAFVDQLQGGVDVKFTRFPMFYDEIGERITDEIMDALDDDDGVKLTEAASDFLPRRFRISSEPDTTPSSGAPIER